MQNTMRYAFAAALVGLVIIPMSAEAQTVTSLTPVTYQVASSLGVGSKYYIDRTYTLKSVPSALSGGTWIKTSNSNKTYTTTNHINFNVNMPVIAYVAYSSNATVLPAWLSTWTNTGTILQTTDVPLRIYSKLYPAGAIALGGNLASPAVGATEMYVVILKPQVVSPDITAPTVSLSAPVAGATVSGTALTVSATASDNVGVAGVQFLLNGAVLGAEDTTAPYSILWNTTLSTNGTYTLSARARDAAGNLTTSAARTVTVSNAVTPPDLIAPTVSMSTITFTANASDNVAVAGVQFKLDGVNLGVEDTTSPYSVMVNPATLTSGAHIITAESRDAAGNRTTSAGITIMGSSAGLTLDVQLATTTISQTLVRGTVNVPLVGISLRAGASPATITSLRIAAKAIAGTLVASEIQSLGVYDGTTLISSLASLNTSSLDATFSGLNFVVPANTTKILTIKGNIDSNATPGDIYAVYLPALSAITAVDGSNNAITPTGVMVNSAGTVAHTVISSGDVTVVRAPDDIESEAGIIIAGREEVLGKFRVAAAYEAMTLNNLQLLITPNPSATVTSTTAADEVPVVKLYDGATQIGAVSGYMVTGSGGNAGKAYINNLGYVIPRDSSRTITVKGVLNTIAAGADSGASVYTSVMAEGFEAQGAVALDTSITGVTSNQKVVRKTKPTINTSIVPQPTKLNNGLTPAIRFRIYADAGADVSWKKIGLRVAMSGAAMTAVNAVPGTTGTATTIVDMASPGVNLNIANAFSGPSVTSVTQAPITGGTSGYVTLVLASEQVIGAGMYRDYEVKLNFTGVTSLSNTQVTLHRAETGVVNGNVVTLEGVADGNPSFIWSDNSSTAHAESTTDWGNGFLVKTLPSVPIGLYAALSTPIAGAQPSSSEVQYAQLLETLKSLLEELMKIR